VVNGSASVNQSATNIKSVLIVGGGTAGWMAAAYLNRCLHDLGCQITLVESVKLETTAVGEVTLPSLVRCLRGMKCDEVKFMQQCSATYNLATCLVNWMKDGAVFWQPHSLPGNTIDNLDVYHFWLKEKRSAGHCAQLDAYSLHALLAQRDLAPRPLRGPSPIMEAAAYGYHLDPATFADFFRELAVAEDVNHLFDDVQQVAVSDGHVHHVETRSGRKLAADIYIDCTAAGDLIEGGQGDAWQSWSSQLLCDRMMLLPLPRDPQSPPYTRVQALDAGWMWRIPLSDRVACGYTYSSAHIADDAALRELVGHASPKKAATGEPRFLKLRQGRRQHMWRGNCVALGPAAVVLEPLAATDAFLAQKAMELLIHFWPDKTFCPALVSAYNQKMTDLAEKVRDFVLLHYLLNARGEPFWNDSRELVAPASLRAIIDLHAENGLVESGAVFSEARYHQLFTAAERWPRRSLTAVEATDVAKVSPILQQMRAQNEDWAAKLPSHRELMEALHRPLV
jgi:tryptophan halogenase